MTETVRPFSLRKRREDPGQQDRRDLAEGLAQTSRLINQAYQSFNAVRDPDLIESYVYEINALQSRYAYLLRRLKELDGIGKTEDNPLPRDWHSRRRWRNGMAAQRSAWIVGGLILALALAALRRPLRTLLRLGLRTGVGLGVLWLLHPLGSLAGLQLGSICSMPWCWGCWACRGWACCCWSTGRWPYRKAGG